MPVIHYLQHSAHSEHGEHGDERYVVGLRYVRPGETVAIDIRALRDSRTPDVEGRVLPPDIQSGQIHWLRRHGPALVANLLTVNAAKRTASTFSFFCCYCSPRAVQLELDPGSKNAQVGEVIGEQLWEKLIDCHNMVTSYPVPSGEAVSWESSNYAVAYVSSSSSHAQVYCGPATGAATIRARKGIVWYNEAPFYPPPNCYSDDPTCIPPNPPECQSNEDYGYAEANFNVSAPPPPPPPSVSVTTADIVSDQIVVSLSPASSSGTLVVTAQGPSVSKSVFNGTRSGGQHSFSFGRATLPIGSYTSVTATWLGASGSRSVSFHALGVYRHSQYNTPSESACIGNQITAWVIGPSCTFTQTTLRSDFASQVFTNGTGTSNAHGILKYTTSCSNYPAGANSQNSSLQVPSVTGSCNVGLVGGQHVATFPNPNLATSFPTWTCGDDLLYVTTGGANQASKRVYDYCPACATGFGGTSGHIDDYSSATACSSQAVGDYGNYMTIRLRASP